MKIRINYVIILLCLLVSTIAQAEIADSLKLEVKKGKWVVSHQVDPGETLFSISQRYNAEIDGIMEVNGISDYSISVGSILFVPYPTAGKAEFHEVKEGETLFSLSKEYDVSVSEIMDWNSMDSYDLSVGQKVKVYLDPGGREVKETNETNEGEHIVSSGETLYSISKNYDVSVDDLRRWNNLSGTDVSEGQTLKITGPEAVGVVVVTGSVIAADAENEPVQDEIVIVEDSNQTPAPPFVLPENPKVALLEKEIESGMAELIEGTEDSNKYLALHKSAENGTILCVENEMNHQAVFVRVVGNIPRTSENDRVVVKLSKAAYDQLDAVNSKFRVVVTKLKSDK